MKAIRLHEPTGIDGLVFEEVPDAAPMLGDVLVKVDACGITHNELDWPLWTCRAGHRRSSIIPGHEVSGVVVGLGYGTAGFAVGDEVYGLTDQFRDGAAAEYVAVEARNVARKPETVDHRHAAAVPRAGLTAWQGLFDHGKLANGQTVVIHGAGGAVGSTAVQLARWAGAEVIGTGRGRVRSQVMELGAASSHWTTTTPTLIISKTWLAGRTWCSTRSAGTCWPARPPCCGQAASWS
jgi:NADPH:quinone reductase-like Zn-dependent oxidoreductase